MIQAHRSGWWMAAIVLVATGCTSTTADTPDPEVLSASREKFMLAEEPDGAVGVVDLRETLVGTEDTETSTAAADRPEMVVLVARVGGVPNPWKDSKPDYPWSSGRAEFVVADAAAAAEIEGHGHAHDDPDHECPFCASHAHSDVVAIVRFTDEAGKILSIDARELFELEGDETVVVRGSPKFVGAGQDGLLVVDAEGIYVRR